MTFARIGLSGAIVCAVGMGAAAARGDLVPVSQARSVTAHATADNATPPGTTNTQTFTAGDFAPFHASASATAAGDLTDTGAGTAAQFSIFGRGEIVVSLRTNATGAC